MNVQHSSATQEWGTPTNIVESARKVLGAIDLDPASSTHWNETVLANKFYTQQADGLTLPWHGNVFVNPPGGKTGNQSNTVLFWIHLMRQVQVGSVDHAIFMAFSLEAMQSTQGREVPSILDFPICVPSKRIRFVSAGVEKHAPSHSNVVVYIPGNDDNRLAFANEFSQYGKVRL